MKQVEKDQPPISEHMRRFSKLVCEYLDALPEGTTEEIANLGARITTEILEELTRRLQEAKEDAQKATVHR